MSDSVLIAGYFGFGNTGDEAILSGMLRDFRELDSEVRFVVVTGNPSETHAMHGVSSVLWTDLPAIARNMREVDLVVLGGGGLFHDYWGCDSRRILTASHSGISYYAGIPLMAYLLGKPSMLYAVGIGPLYSEEAKRMTAIALGAAHLTTLRDEPSLRVVSHLDTRAGLDSCRCEVTADPAFSLEPADDHETSDVLSQARLEAGRPLLGVCLRHWAIGVDQERWEEEVAAGIDRFLDRHDHQVLFVPFQAGANPDLQDVRVAERIVRFMKHSERTSVLTTTLSPRVAYSVLGRCSVVLGMRLHAVLFAINAAVPTVALAYDQKVQSLMDRAGLNDYTLAAASWKRAEIADHLHKALGSDRSGTPGVFRHQTRTQARRNAEMALGLTGSRGKVDARVDAFVRDLGLSRILLLDESSATESGLANEVTSLRESLTREQAEVHSLREQINLNEANVTGLRSRLTDVLETQAGLDARMQDLLEVQAASEAQKKTDHELRTRLESELFAIRTSRLWRAMSIYWRARQWPNRLVSLTGSGVRRAARKLGLGRVWRWMQHQGNTVLAAKVLSQSPPEWEGRPAAPGKVDILVLPIIAWGFRFQRPQHLARQFARNGHRVFYLATALHDGGRVTWHPLEEGVFEVALPGPPGKSIYTDVLSEDDARVLEGGLAELAAAAGMNEAICLLQLPFWRPLASLMRSRLGWRVVYDCLDEHGGFDTNSSQMLAEETRLLQECDLALATSAALVRKCETLAKHVVLIPNAVDYEALSQAASQAARPPEMIGIPGPIIGYVGAISEWFDFSMIRHAATAHPEWNFVLVGRDWGAEEHGDLFRRSNVHFIGEQPYDRLPAFLAHFDICCIPFKTSSLTEATDPVKLYEYLAVGKPVVSTPIAEVVKRESLVRIAGTPGAFATAIELELARNVPEAIEQRKMYAAHNTWAQRFASLEPAIAALYQRVSVIVLAWNNLELTKACLASLDRTSCHPALELILIDNASTDGTAEYFSRLEASGVAHAVINRENRGFAPAMNQGLRKASGEIIVLLNNDVVLTRGWLSKLVARLESDPSIGIVGPVSNGAGNEAHLDAGYSGLEDLEEFAASVESQYRCEIAPVRMLAMFCMAGRREVFQVVGALDEQFEVGMFEDDDYSIRVRAAGFGVSCARDVYIHHHGQSGFRLHGTGRYSQLFDLNCGRFESKWGVKWERHKYGDLTEAIALTSALAQILTDHREAKGIVVVPPPIDALSTLRSAYRSAAAELAASGYLTFWCDSESPPRLPERVNPRMFRIPPLAEALDVVREPLIPSWCQNPAFQLRLRRPRPL